MPSPLVLIIFGLLTFLAAFVYGGISLAPWVPMRKRDLARVMRLANLKEGEIFYDLGCGDGRIIRATPKNVTAIGLEINPWLFLYSKIKSFKNKNKIIKLKSLFKEDLSKADVVFVFGTPRTIARKLQAKLDKNLKPGARVISYAFSFPGWQPIIKDKSSQKDISIFLYKV